MNMLSGMPRSVFVEVDDVLITLLRREAAGRLIVDCGAGMGVLGQMAPEVLSIDLYPPDEPLSPVVEYDARQWPIGERHMPVFLRPDHGGWVDEVLQAETCKAKSAIYVGLETNLLMDLPATGFAYHIEKIKGWEGTDGERAWRVVLDPDPPAKQEFFLIRDRHYGWTFWVQLGTFADGSRCYEGIVGGRMPAEPDLYEEIRTEMAYGFDLLDWHGTYLEVQDSESGWLDRNGQFYPCDSRSHDIYAELVLRKTVADLERLGWVRVCHPDEWMMIGRWRLSPEQARWLDRQGHDVEETD